MGRVWSGRLSCCVTLQHSTRRMSYVMAPLVGTMSGELMFQPFQRVTNGVTWRWTCFTHIRQDCLDAYSRSEKIVTGVVRMHVKGAS